MYDIVTIGSAVADVFVKTPDDSSEVRTHGEHHDVCYHIGAKILINDIHFETGGGGTNAAVAFARMGFNTGYVGKLGNDANTHKMLAELKKEKVDFLGTCGEGNMGFSVIMIGIEHDRTILTYKGLNNSLESKDVKRKALSAKRMYFSSMLGKSWETALELATYATRKNIPYTFNPSSYLAKEGLGKLKTMLKGCQFLSLNKEEAQTLLRLPETTLIQDLLIRLHKFVPIVAITDGKKGAFATDGAYFYAVTPRPTKVIETTGAGDAFASGVTAGLAWHMDLDDALKLGMIQAESVLAFIGAKNKLLTKKEIMADLHSTRAPRVFRTKIRH